MSQKLTKKQQKALKHRAGTKGKKQVEQPALPEPDEEAIEQIAQKDKGKKRKRDDADAAPEAPETTPKPVKSKKSKDSKKRLIVFVGNLSFDVTVDQIIEHFSQCGEKPAVRLLTKKGEQGKPDKSKGCAFVEFTEATALQAALRLHQSQLGKRKINVELTAGGGGKGETRQAKLAETKKRLEAQREKKADAQATTKTTKSEEAEQRKKQKLEEPQTESTPKEKKMKKPWLSGSNAIRVHAG